MPIHAPFGLVRISDDSLRYDDPPLRAGDVLVVEATAPPDDGDLVLLVIHGQTLVRYFYNTPNGLIRLEARNLEYPPIWAERGEYVPIGRVKSQGQRLPVYHEGQKV